MKLKLKMGCQEFLRHVHYRYNNSHVVQAKHYMYASEEGMRKYMLNMRHIINFISALISAKKIKKHIFLNFNIKLTLKLLNIKYMCLLFIIFMTH